MTDSGVLRATSVNVRYRDVVAVRDVTLEVRPGQLVAVTGPSGAGKTSLLHALAGIVTPAEGAVSCGGQEVRRRVDAVEQSIVLIPQGNALAAVLTALENVAMPLLARAALVEGARDAALAALAAVGVDEAADQLIDELSGGQQQRVAVARGIAQQGVALLADEPTSELDSGNRTRVMDVLASEVRRGAAVVMATHDPETADLCDAELRLDEGVATWIRDDR
ncbi:MAG TPA: ATP-binding cassette domain-containing protein [Jatrophihabitantaceae bacterium]|nr:ATP-binding cassette domain-containing protein [Jatrophihabitantaceae bacterium]